MIATVRWSDFAVAAILVLAVGIACWLGAPALKAMGKDKLIVFFVLLVGVCVLVGAPIAFVSRWRPSPFSRP